MDFCCLFCRYGTIMFPTQSLQKLRDTKIGLKLVVNTLHSLVVGPSLSMALFITSTSSSRLRFLLVSFHYRTSFSCLSDTQLHVFGDQSLVLCLNHSLLLPVCFLSLSNTIFVIEEMCSGPRNNSSFVCSQSQRCSG